MRAFLIPELHPYRYSEARECLQAAVDLNSNYTKAYYRLGLVEKHLKNYEEALRNFDKVLRLEPNNKATIKECDEIKSKLGISSSSDRIGANSLNALSNRDSITAGRNATLASDQFRPTNASKPDQASTESNASSVRPNAASLKLERSAVASKKAAIKVENIAIPKLNIPVRLPTSRPKSAYQFNLFWKEIRDSQTKLDYLQFVGAEDFLRLFQKNLEPDFLSELIVLFEQMERRLAFALLCSISKIEKFDFFILFLSKAEKVSLRQIINSLQADPADLELLTKLYKV